VARVKKDFGVHRIRLGQPGCADEGERLVERGVSVERDEAKREFDSRDPWGSRDSSDSRTLCRWVMNEFGVFFGCRVNDDSDDRETAKESDGFLGAFTGYAWRLKTKKDYKTVRSECGLHRRIKSGLRNGRTEVVVENGKESVTL
jgi:hypothetical protein